MHLLLTAVGTHGDIIPFVALGLGLREAGHRVTIASHEDYEALVSSKGLGFRPLSHSFVAMMDSEEGRRWLNSGSSPTGYLRSFERLFLPVSQTWLDELHEAATDCDGLLFHAFNPAPVHEAERRDIPAVGICLSPVLPSRVVPPAMMRRSLPVVGGVVNQHLSTFLLRAVAGPFMDIHHDLRRRLGLPPMTARSVYEHLFDRQVPFLCLYSPTLSPRPEDWPPHWQTTGFCFLDDEPEWSPSEELVRFVEDGEPPLYVGFGSTTGYEPAALARLVFDAVRKSRSRAVLVTGWGAAAATEVPEEVHVTKWVSHRWLLPKVSAVVHHGGAGTTAAGLRAGRPTIVVAFAGDQIYWGRRVEDLGAGPAPIPRKRLDARGLCRAIETVARRRDRYASEASRLGAALEAEQGLGATLEAVKGYLG